MPRKMFYQHKIENLIVVEKIVTIHYFEFSKDFAFRGESHDFWEFAYADKGEVICSRETEEIALKQGGIIFHRPDEFHTIRSNGVTAPNVFVISFVCKSAAMEFFSRKQFILNAKLRNYISAVMAEAKQTFDLPSFEPGLKKLEKLENPNLGGLQMIRTLLEQFFILLMREQSQKTGAPEMFLPKESFPEHIENLIKAYLADNLYQKLSLSDLCKKFSYGKTFICTEFKKRTGKTIFDYFVCLRINEAKKLIREQNLTFSQISQLLNFDSPAYFTTTFKRVTGMNPSEYTKSIKMQS